MRHTRLEDSEVFNAFADIAAKEGLLEKKAEYLYPDYDISEATPELDVKFAGDKRTELYDVTGGRGEDLIQSAHPGGGVVADESGSHDYGKVETIIEEQQKNRGVAEGKPTGKLAALMEKLVSLADELDTAGFEVLAKELDAEMEKMAVDPQGQPYAELPAGALQSQGPQALQPGYKDPRLDPKLQEYMKRKQKAKQQQQQQEQQEQDQFAELPEGSLRMPAPQALQTGTKPPMGPRL